MGRRIATGTTVTVRVPATSANLGPGFDCFGLALDWYEQLELSVIADDFQIDITGEGADYLPRDDRHLVIRSVLVGLADLRVEVPGLRLRGHNRIPHGRGLGSSSAAIVAGLTAAAALAGREPDPAWLLRHATTIEGHPDNVAAAIYGGFVLAYQSRSGVAVASARLDPSIAATVFVPATPVATHAARSLLPAAVPHDEAAANAGRAALLVHALAEDPDCLWEATRDWLHQSYRAGAMPESAQLMARLRERGFAAFISGAGPTVAVLRRREDLGGLSELAPVGFSVRHLSTGAGASAQPGRG